MKKRNAKFTTVQAVKIYLQTRYRIPSREVDDIVYTLMDYSVRQANSMKYDRIYSAVALATRRAFGFGRKRIMKVLSEFDRIAGYIAKNDDGYGWGDCMKELHEETGLYVWSTDKDEIAVEWKPKGWRLEEDE